MATENNNKTLNVPNLRFPEFSGEWTKTKLGDIGTTLIGLTYSPKDVVPSGGTIVLRSSNIKGGLTDYNDIVRVNKKIKESIITRVDDLLICARNGSARLIGKNAILKQEDCGHTFGAFMMVYRAQNNKFVHQLLNTKRYYSQVGENLGARINQITTSDLNSFEFYFPQTLNEQNKIASMLSLLDDRIATQIKIIEKLESLIKGLYERLFNIDGAAYIQLGNVAKIQKGQQINGEELSEIGSYYVMNGGVVPSGYLEDFNTPANTISISEGGNSCGYVQYNGVPFWSGGHCYTLIEPINSFNYKYLFHYLKFKEQSIMALRIGSGLPNIQKKDLERFPILNVSKEEQDKMACIFDDILDRIICERQIALKYEEQKKYLLSNLFI